MIGRLLGLGAALTGNDSLREMRASPLSEFGLAALGSTAGCPDLSGIVRLMPTMYKPQLRTGQVPR